MSNNIIYHTSEGNRAVLLLATLHEDGIEQERTQELSQSPRVVALIPAEEETKIKITSVVQIAALILGHDGGAHALDFVGNVHNDQKAEINAGSLRDATLKLLDIQQIKTIDKKSLRNCIPSKNSHNLLSVGLREILADGFSVSIDIGHQLRAKLLREQINNFINHGGNLGRQGSRHSGPAILKNMLHPRAKVLTSGALSKSMVTHGIVVLAGGGYRDLGPMRQRSAAQAATKSERANKSFIAVLLSHKCLIVHPLS